MAVAVADAALIARAQAGDETAFEVIFNQYHAAIYNYVFRMMGNPEDASDLTQDTFLKAWRALSRTSDDLRVGAWLYRIATNVCLDELRHRKLIKWQSWDNFVSVFHPVAKESPERDVVNRENREEVQYILDRLNPKYRLCILLREYQGLSYDGDRPSAWHDPRRRQVAVVPRPGGIPASLQDGRTAAWAGEGVMTRQGAPLSSQRRVQFRRIIGHVVRQSEFEGGTAANGCR